MDLIKALMLASCFTEHLIEKVKYLIPQNKIDSFYSGQGGLITSLCQNVYSNSLRNVKELLSFYYLLI